MRPPKQKQHKSKRDFAECWNMYMHVDVEEFRDPRSEIRFWIFQKKRTYR